MAISYGTYTITEIGEGSQIWTSSAAPTTPDYTFDVSHLTGDSDIPIREGDIILNSYYRYTVLSISSDGTTVLTGNRTSIRGATGAASVTYALIVSNLAIVKDKDGNLSPNTITVTAKSQTGSNAMANYTGRIKIETTTNNSTWTSRINEDAATKTYTIPSDTVAIRCSLYLKGGTTTLLDQQTVPVVSDGIDGTNITITSTSVTYQKGTSGTVKPTGTWRTDVPNIAQGNFLWTKTIVNYSDNSSTESYSVARQGNDGTSPTVSNTVIKYQQSTNGKTVPTGTWENTPPTAIAEQFMWTRTTVTYSDNATAISYSVSRNGTNGNNGINTATVYLYKKGTTAPSVPSGNTTYTFSTKKLTGTLDNWSQAIPTTGTGECYITAAVASSNTSTDTIATGEWSTPIQFNGTNGTNGTDGTNGLNQATIFLYKRGASVTKPTTSVTYTFSTGALSAEPNSWKRNIPTIDGNPCWVVTATAIGNGTTATITGNNWSDPVKLVEDGEDGKDAYTIVLTNENHTFAGNSVSAIASEMECNVIAYKGTTQIAATIGTITGQPTGMTTSLSNNGTTNASFTVAVTTNMVTKNGVLTIPITVDNKTFTKKFTYSLALKGISGTSENLLMDVYASSLTKVDAPWNRYLSDAGNSSITGEFIAENNLPDPNATHFYRITDSSATTKGRGLCFYNNGTPPFLEGNTYRIGCWVRSHSGEPQISFTLGGSLGSWLVKRKVSNTEWEWVEAVHTFGNSNAIDGTPTASYKRLYFYFYNNNVENTSLDMCGFRLERVNVDNGTARNILRKTETLDGWTTTNGATISNGIVTFPTSTSDVFRGLKYPSRNINYSIVRNKYCIISMKVKANIGERCCVNVESGFTDTETNNLLQKYKTQYIYFTGTGEWQTICASELLTDYSFTSGSGGGTINFNNCWFRINLYAQKEYHNSFELKEPQLCLGTTATSWTPAPEDIEEEVSNLRTDLQSQIDEKIQTYYQATAPSWSNATDRAKHDGDLWYCTETDLYTGYEAKNVYRYNSTNNTWVGYSVTSELFDAVDGKSTIYYGTTTDTFEDVEDGDYLVDSATGSTYRYYNDSWVTVTDYQTAIDNIEIGGRNILKGSDVAHTSLSGTVVGGTTTQVIPSNTVITLSVQVDADNVVWGSSGNKRIGVASSIPKDSGGTQYIEAWAAMTGRTGTGIDKTFDTSFHGRVKSTYTLQGELPLDKAFNLHIQSVTSGTVKVSRPKLEIGNKATDWTPAPEDIEEEIGSKADSSVAVEEEQLIYISKASGTNTVTGTTTWVTGTGDVQNTWTTKRPTYNSSYPVLFIAKQKKTVSGTVTCTTPLKDDTTTVIDGGHITTGTIDASQVTVTNIDASKITTGTLKADVIGANSLSISQISGLQNSLNGKQPTGDYATNNDVTTAINNIEVGGRNLIINTLNPDATAAKRPKFFGQTVNTVGRGTASTANHGIRFTTTSAAYCYMYMGFTAITGGTGATLQGLTIGETYTFSCDFTCKLMSNDTSSTAIRYFRFYPMNDSTGTFTTSEYGDMIALTQADKGVEKSNRFEYTFTIPEGTTKFGFMFRVATTTNSLYATGDFIEFKNMKLEKGNKATDWTPAQEDTNTEINNAEKVATNYLAIDESGIMVADMKDGQQTPSTASGRNVLINNNSVDIRDGQNTLASFTSESTKFYDMVSSKEVASFGTDGARVGNKDEQHFVVSADSINAINENGSPIFTITSTDGTITNVVKSADGAKSAIINTDISLEGGEDSPSNTFYIERITVNITVPLNKHGFDTFYCDSVSQNFTITGNTETFDTTGIQAVLNGFSFTYGTPKTMTHTLTGTFTKDNQQCTYNGLIELVYSGARGLTLKAFKSKWYDSSGTEHATAFDNYIISDVMSSFGYSSAPSMTFGTRAIDGIVAPLSATIGEGLYANSNNQLSVGKYNLNNDSESAPLAFAVGNGTDDLDRSNAFNIDWYGNTEVGGNLEVVGDADANRLIGNSLHCNGASKFTGKMTYDGSNGLFFVKSYSYTVSSINANSAWSYNADVTVSGYIGMAICGFQVEDDGGWCVFPKCYVWNETNKDTLSMYIWNQKTTPLSNIKVWVKVFYVARSAY